MIDYSMGIDYSTGNDWFVLLRETPEIVELKEADLEDPASEPVHMVYGPAFLSDISTPTRKVILTFYDGRQVEGIVKMQGIKFDYFCVRKESNGKI